jgi:maltose alpha-D-glucosyltransferase/alpha-amylase
LVALDRFLNAASRSAADPFSSSGKASLKRMAGEYLDTASSFGSLTADLHLALAAAPHDDPDFSAEQIVSDDVEAWIEGCQREEGVILKDLSRYVDKIPGAFTGEMAKDVGLVASRAAELLNRFQDMQLLAEIKASKIRVHGDYHLGQLLRAAEPADADGAWIIMDFEGEPARPLAARRAKQSPMRDLAGMLRSFDYATKVAIRHFLGRDAKASDAVRTWTGAWQEGVRDRFLRAYRERAGAANFLPHDDKTFYKVLAAFELQKAIYELGYEMNNRPTWVRIPVLGIEQLLG